MGNISSNVVGLSNTTPTITSNAAVLPKGKIPKNNGINEQLLTQLIKLIQQLLTQLQGGSGGKDQTLKEIQFDSADYERPPVPVYDSSGQYYRQVVYHDQLSYMATRVPDANGNIFGEGYIGEAPFLPDGSGFDTSYDIRPHINGVAVVKIDYQETTARYTLENGQVITGLKPARTNE